MNLKKIIVAFFFAVSYSLSFGDEVISPQSTNVDSVQIYHELITKEYYNSDYKPNIVGMIVGGGIMGVGTYFLVGGIYGMNYKNGDATDEIFTTIGGSIMLAMSVPFYLIGTPILIYNIYQYNVHKGHLRKSDEYQAALDRYKLRKRGGESSALQLMIFPELNFIEKRGGVNAVVRF
jgi:hypothetical protein